MNAYYMFSDESGTYMQIRSAKHKQVHPFYVRVSVLISLDDYCKLESEVSSVKARLGIPESKEVKWSEIGQRFCGRVSPGMEDVSESDVQAYIENIIRISCEFTSARVIATVYDNSDYRYHSSEAVMLKMHMQNAMQRAQHDMDERDGFVTIIFDDVGENTNRRIKELCHELLANGDLVKYTRVKKSILVDYSHHCAGLQLADYCAGIITACLIRIQRRQEDNFLYANRLFTSYLYKIMRRNQNSGVYPYGIREVPDNCGRETCQALAKCANLQLSRDAIQQERV